MTTSEFSLLPGNVRPVHYGITLTPDLETFTFQGEETVEVEITEATSQIVLNAQEIQVQVASATPEGGSALPAKEIQLDDAAQTVTLAFGAPLPAGRVQLSFRFTGELNDRLHGFYRGSYRTPEGETRYLACTQFEPTDARRAFPCWDEPAHKATFDVTLVIPSHLTAISNTPIEGEAVEGEKNRVTFARTPIMSTYLLAFMVGEFESIEAPARDGTTIRVWTTPGKVEQGRFALETSVNLLSYFNDYFGIPYPLPKLDHIALPDFAAGAMENWGAITYRETALLVDPANSAAGTRQRVAEVVAHEMAHMWFGDLVTMEWWNDLWLNESFASWMGTKAIDQLHTDWQMWTQFLVDDVAAGLSLDGLKNSHPIQATVRDPSEVNQLFDAISYSKGASLLRMLEQFLGEETFQRGLHAYLSAHQYGNARGADLWRAQGEASGQPVPAIMESWIQQTGYPLVEVQIRREDNGAEVRLTQERFLYHQPQGTAPETAVWQAPVAVRGQEATEEGHMLLDRREGSLRLDQVSSGWLKVNAGQTGFYRVSYPPEEWARFIPVIETLELSPADRFGLQNDAYALCRAGLLPATRYLELAGAYRNETEYALWRDLGGNLREMDLLFAGEAYQSQFRDFARELFQPIAGQVGWEPRPGEGHLQALLRSIALGELGVYNDPGTLEEAQRRFTAYVEDPASLSPDLRAAVYGLAAQSGDEATHDTMRRLAREATLQEEKVRLFVAMRRFRQADLVQRTLELSLSSEVRPQDTVGVVTSVASTPQGRGLAWEFVKDNWEEFDRRYGSGGFGLMRLVGITGHFTRPEERQEVEQFFQAHPVPAASRTVQQSLERIDLNMRWLGANRTGLAEWFSGRIG